MRDAVGGTWIFGLVISFTMIFAGFLILAITYSKAYRIKNEMTNIIEKYEGLTSLAYKNDGSTRKGSIGIMNDFLRNSAYSAKGKCNVGDLATDDLDNIDYVVEVDEANVGDSFYYCITPIKDKCNMIFEITVFYNFNLPILGQLYKYSITGQTKGIYQAIINNEIQTCS